MLSALALTGKWPRAPLCDQPHDTRAAGALALPCTDGVLPGSSSIMFQRCLPPPPPSQHLRDWRVSSLPLPCLFQRLDGGSSRLCPVLLLTAAEGGLGRNVGSALQGGRSEVCPQQSVAGCSTLSPPVSGLSLATLARARSFWRHCRWHTGFSL